MSRVPATPTAEPMPVPMWQALGVLNLANPVAAGEATNVGGAGGTIGAVAATYAPGGALGATQLF